MSWIGPAIQATDNLFQRFENRYQFNKANEFSAEQAQLQRDWESVEAEKARQWQSDEWQRQFNLYNEYNSPSAQMARLKEAGQNPFLNQTAIGTGNSAPSGTPSTSAPSGASASSVSPPYGQIHEIGSLVLGAQSVSANNANQRAQALQATVKTALEALKISPSAAKEILKLGMSQYKFSDDDFNRANQLLDAEVLKNESQAQEAELHKDLVAKYGDEKAYHETMNLKQAYTESVYKCGLMASQGKLNDSQIKVNEAKVYELAASVVEHYAHAFKLNAEANTIESLRSLLVTQLQIQNGREAVKFDTEYNEWLGNRPLREINESISDPKSPNYWIFKFVHAFDKLLGERIGVALGISKIFGK